MANSQTSVHLRTVCPECKKFFAASIKSNGEIVGQCPNCHSQYYEQRHDNVRLIKSVKRQNN